MRRGKIKIIVEKHKRDYIAYPIGMKGVVVGQGDTYEDALKDTRLAIQFHANTFGAEAWDHWDDIQEVFVAESEVSR